MNRGSVRSLKPLSPGWAWNVPAAWNVGALKWIAKLYAGGTPDKENAEYWKDGTIPWLNSGAVNQWRIAEPSAYISEEAYRNSSAKWIPQGALVIALAGQGKTKGMVAEVAIDTTCNQSMAAIVPDERAFPRFLLWWLAANYETIRNLAGGEQRDGLNLEMVGGIPCPIPPLAEQKAVASFLDRETARLDALVTEKVRLLELLAEKRRALITRAVTRGLNPAAPLRGSGLPWLGQIPAHWEVAPFRWYFHISSGSFLPTDALEPDYNEDHPVPVIGGNGIAGYTRDANTEGLTIVIGRVGALCGNVHLVAGKAWVTDNALSLDRIRGFIPEYLADLLRDMNLNSLANKTAQPLVTGSMILDLRGPLPPITEQRAIVAHIAAHTAELDALRAAAEQTIGLLKERRAALVAAAVTGRLRMPNAS